MDSSEGFDRGPSRPLSRTLTNIGFTDAMDPEVVPSSLPGIAAVLRVANEVEHKYGERRVAYLCRFHAFEKAHNLDQNSTGRGVRQFKTALLSKLERDVDITKSTSSSDARVMRTFYENYYNTYIKTLESPDSENVDRAQLARTYKTANILFEVWKAVSQTEPDDELAKESEVALEREKIYGAYNILPLDEGSSAQAIMKLPEVIAAVTAVRSIRGLPFPDHEANGPKGSDILDWLRVMFGFQKHNVENQREHLILLLANAHTRRVGKADRQNKLDDKALEEIFDKLFENYKRWCKFLGRQEHLELPKIRREIQQQMILYIGLYLLIWGEAANLRFMPESLCYIFHHMAFELHGMLAGNVSSCTGENISPAYGGEENAFLEKVVKPIYNVIAKENQCNKNGKARHSAWRNYDDLNEYFWSTDCFRLNWPMMLDADFFTTPTEKSKFGKKQQYAWSGKTQPVEGHSSWQCLKKQHNWIGKTQFVEVRTFWHIFRSFDRMWSFLILSFQAMLLVAWNGSGPITDVFHPNVLEKVLSIFITGALLRFIQAVGDFVLGFKAWRSMKFTDVLRYILKVFVAFAWVIILPLCYAYTLAKPSGLFRTLKNWFGQSSTSQSLYITALTLYLVPDGLGILLFLLPELRRVVEQSDLPAVQLLLWWSQPRLYIGRGMHENRGALLKYTLFWVLVFVSKFSFSYYVEIRPLVGPSKEIMQAPMENPFAWHELFPKAKDNWGVLIAIWSPVVMVYFMDTQIWYAVWSTISGGATGALQGLGEIRTLAMLKSRFSSLPGAFNLKLVSSSRKPEPKSITLRRTYEKIPLTEAPQFCNFWNDVILTLRDEDYINNEEKEFLLMPDSSERTQNLVQFPPFLLAGKIHIALDTAKDFTEKGNDAELIKRIETDDYMICAIKECYALFKDLLRAIVIGDTELRVINDLLREVEDHIATETLTEIMALNALPLLYRKFVELLEVLDEEGSNAKQGMVIRLLQDMLEVYTKDVRVQSNSNIDIVDANQGGSSGTYATLYEQYPELFATNAIHPSPSEFIDIGWKDQIRRLRLLLRDSSMEVPTNLEARRRIAYFTNSLFMDMPPAPEVRDMLSFSVFTPYYQEEILYTREGLEKENEDGVSILYYLQKIYPDEWKNFLQRTGLSDETLWERDFGRDVREWASYRAQTLTRTVRGMMYYRRALELQAFADMATTPDMQLGYEKAVLSSGGDNKQRQMLYANIQAVADMKFTYVATCQIYGRQKRSGEANDILNLMKLYPSLRVAYIDEVEKGGKITYYSVLVKGIRDSDSDQEIYRIELPGRPMLGEGKPENQNHAIIFTRGEALQAIDMNQDNYLEEAFKMRNLLQEFTVDAGLGLGFPAIVGMREHIFTGSVSSLAGFMSNQESSFVTIGQRVLANPLKVRFHYGHPDVFDRLFHITRGGISKASRVINLSEDIFAGFNTTLRRGNVTHHEYIQVGKGRDVGLNQISLFEAKIANGNGEQTMSRDVYRLGHRFDFFRMLSAYFTTVGFYFSTLIVVLTVYVFLYGRIYLALSGLEQSLVHLAGLENSSPLQAALASQAVVQIGLLMAIPMVMEIGLEKGYQTALSEFIVMQLQLASVFFTFSMGTRVHFYGRTLLHGGAKYRSTGRGFVVFHAKFAENYRLYSRSHFTKGLELLILLIVYNLYGVSVKKTAAYFLVTWSLWFLVGTWLFAPFLFNPSGFEWQKIVDDWTDWIKWVGNRGGVGVEATKSWESWWEEEQSHLATTGLRGQLFEILLAARFLLYQYGLVYHLNITHRSKSILVYGLSWVVLVFVLATLKVVSMGRRRFKARYQIFFRLLKGIFFISAIAALGVLFSVEKLTVGDIFVSFLAFIPSGWAILQIAQTGRFLLKKVGMWGSIKALARAYEYIMGSLLFAPVATLAWFPFISDFQTRLLFNQAFSRGLQISRILAGRQEKKSN